LNSITNVGSVIEVSSELVELLLTIYCAHVSFVHTHILLLVRNCRAYDPAEFDHLPVSTELKELFQHIRRYSPQNIELDLKLKPFIPDYIPAIGDIDAFIKVWCSVCACGVCSVCACGVCSVCAYVHVFMRRACLCVFMYVCM